MFERILKNKAVLSLSIAIIVFCIIILFTKFFYTLDRNMSEVLHASTNNALSVSPEILIVEIDEESIAELWRFPFPRDAYVDVIENLNAAGAAVIAFDIIFADKSDTDKDAKLGDAIKEAKNVVLGWATLKRWSRVFLERPLANLEEWAADIWYFRPIVNPVNERVYSIHAEKHLSDSVNVHFSVAILREYFWNLLGKDFRNFAKDDKNYFYVTPDRKFPYHNHDTKEVNINFVRDDWRFQKESFINIHNNSFINRDKDLVNGKIVIIWATAQWIKDIFLTSAGTKYWVYTHANMVNMWLTREFRAYFNKNLEFLLLFLLIVFSVFFNLQMSGKKLVWGNISIFFIFCFVIVFISWWLGLYLNYVSQFIFALILTLTISNILKSFMEDKNKAKLSKALWEYVSKDIADQILHWEGDLNLDGQRKMLSIRFSDIKWFTTISEKLTPEELVAFLREYLGVMSNIIMDHRGFIDKYEWDAIMAMWWVFGYQETSTFDNCTCALLQQEKLSELNVGWKERFWEELHVRMWLHTWEAIVWNIWATWRKMEFTALWDSVNLASRLEWVNKMYWTYICVSEDVYAIQKENFEFRYLDKIRVKGKNIPIGIYELIGYKWKITSEMMKVREEFLQAIHLYLERKFEEAKVIFEKLAKIWDNPSQTYLERSELYIENPPEADWDWVWNMLTK